MGVTTATSVVATLGHSLSAAETRPREQANSTLQWCPVTSRRDHVPSLRRGPGRGEPTFPRDWGVNWLRSPLPPPPAPLGDPGDITQGPRGPTSPGTRVGPMQHGAPAGGTSGQAWGADGECGAPLQPELPPQRACRPGRNSGITFMEHLSFQTFKLSPTPCFSRTKR